MTQSTLINCEDCGARVRRKLKPGRGRVCVECGIKRAAAAARAMHAKHGPQWERYVASGQVLGRIGAPHDAQGRFAPDPPPDGG